MNHLYDAVISFEYEPGERISMVIELTYDPDEPNRYRPGGTIKLKLDDVRVEFLKCIWLNVGVRNTGSRPRHNCALQAKVLGYPHPDDEAPSPSKIFDVIADDKRDAVDLQPGREALLNLAVRMQGYRVPYHRTVFQPDRQVVGYIGKNMGNLDSGLLGGIYNLRLTLFSDEEEPRTYEAELEVCTDSDDFDFRITKSPRPMVLSV